MRSKMANVFRSEKMTKHLISVHITELKKRTIILWIYKKTAQYLLLAF